MVRISQILLLGACTLFQAGSALPAPADDYHNAVIEAREPGVTTRTVIHTKTYTSKHHKTVTHTRIGTHRTGKPTTHTKTTETDTKTKTHKTDTTVTNTQTATVTVTHTAKTHTKPTTTATPTTPTTPPTTHTTPTTHKTRKTHKTKTPITITKTETQTTTTTPTTTTTSTAKSTPTHTPTSQQCSGFSFGGSQYTDPQGHTYQIECGFTIVGSDIAAPAASNFGACFALCDAQPGCTAFTWSPGFPATCFLKDGSLPIGPSGFMDSAILISA